jgi:hypothetical protein
MPIGASVTLRGEKMYEFLDRLVSVSFHVYVISKVSMIKLLTAAVTIPWVLQSRSSSLRSISIR